MQKRPLSARIARGTASTRYAGYHRISCPDSGNLSKVFHLIEPISKAKVRSCARSCELA